MKKIFSLILLLSFLHTHCFAFMLMPGNFVASGGATPFFEADWSTNSPGATDETCVTATGCPDIWDRITDPDGFLSVTGGKLRETVTSEQTANYIDANNSAGNIFDGTTISECWLEFTINFGSVTGLKVNSSRYTGFSIKGLLQARIKTNASGIISTLQIYYYEDAGPAWGPSSAWTPSAATDYTVRAYWKKDTDVGADTSDNGTVTISIVGGPTITKTDVDSDTLGYVTQIDLGSTSYNMYASTTYTVDFDDFKFYTSDPSW